MSRNRVVLIAVVVVAFIAIGGYFVLHGTGAGGQQVALNLKVAGSTMTPDNPVAHANDTVTMTITTDKDEKVHLHGYDIPFECKAGQPLSKTFKADKTGDFPMEIEDTSTPLGTFTVRP